jgi:hypothetical protein
MWRVRQKSPENGCSGSVCPSVEGELEEACTAYERAGKPEEQVRLLLQLPGGQGRAHDIARGAGAAAASLVAKHCLDAGDVTVLPCVLAACGCCLAW